VPVSPCTPRDRFAADSPLEEAVTSEPVSAWQFPANREKCRELPLLAADQAFSLLKKARIIRALP
jgi:hypothetical protein